MNDFLYHFTTKRLLRKILKDNCLKISNKTGINAVSLTRDKNLIRRCSYLRAHSCNVCIVLDKSKLKNNYKTKPFDFYSRYKYTGYKEAEEVVERDIINLNSYLVDITYL